MTRVPFALLAAALALLDRATKAWAASALALGAPRELIGSSIRLTRVHNPGGAFGVFPGSGLLFLVVSSLLSAALIAALFSKRIRDSVSRLGVAVLLAGAVGNLIDRALYGYVLDFFELRGFPVFNLADACVTLGAALVVVGLFRRGGEDERSEREADRV